MKVRPLPHTYYNITPEMEECVVDMRLFMMIKYYSESPSKENIEGYKEIERQLQEEIPTTTELIVPSKILFPWRYEKDDYKWAFVEAKECNVEKFKDLAYSILSKLDWTKIDFKIRPKTFISTRKTIKNQTKISALKEKGFNNLYDFMSKSTPIKHFDAESNLCYVSPGNMRCTLKVSLDALYVYSLLEGLIISIKDQIEGFDLGKQMQEIKMKNLKLMLDIKKCGFTIPHKLIVALIETIEELLGVKDDCFKEFLTTWTLEYNGGATPVKRGYGLGFSNYLATLILYIIASDFSKKYHIFNDDQVISLPDYMNYVTDTSQVLDGIVKYYESFDIIINRKKTFISRYSHYLEEVYDENGKKFKNYSKKNRGKLNIINSMFDVSRLCTHFSIISIISQGDYQDLLEEIVFVYKKIGYCFHEYEILASVYDGGLFPEDARVLVKGMHILPGYYVYIKEYEQLVKNFFKKFEINLTKYDIFTVAEAQYLDIDTTSVDIFEDFRQRGNVRPRDWSRLYKKLLSSITNRKHENQLNSLNIWKRRSEKLLATVIPREWLIIRHFDEASSYEHDVSLVQENETLKTIYKIVFNQPLTIKDKAQMLPPYSRIHGLKYPDYLIRSVPFEVPIKDLRATELYFRAQIDCIRPDMIRYLTPYNFFKFEYLFNEYYYTLFRSGDLHKKTKEIKQRKLLKFVARPSKQEPLIGFDEELQIAGLKLSQAISDLNSNFEDQFEEKKVEVVQDFMHPDHIFQNDIQEENFEDLEEAEVVFTNDQDDDDPYNYVIDEEKTKEVITSEQPDLDWDI